MIKSLTLLWAGSVALAATFGGMRVSIPAYRENRASLAGLIAFATGLLFWGLFALHSTSYLQLLGSGVAQKANTPSFLVVGIIGGVTCLVLLFDGSLRLIRQASDR